MALLLRQSSILQKPAFIWKNRQIFLKRRSFNYLNGWDILTISFLVERMEKQNWKSLWRNLINFCRTLNLYMSHRKKEVQFVDLNVGLENGSVTTDLHTKSADCDQYLHCSFSHPDIKNSVIYGQTLRRMKRTLINMR